MIEFIEGLIILTAFLSIIFIFLIKWRKNYKRTGKLLVFNDNLKMGMKNQIKLILKTTFLLGIVLTIAMFWYNQYNHYFGKYAKETINCPKDSNIAVIKIQGEIVTYGTELIDSASETTVSSDVVSSETIVGYFNEIEKDDDIKAIIVEIDSRGGSPMASEEIMDSLKKTTKPTIAVIRESADSGAYLVATGANRIYASRFSEVGSIGVTMSYLDYSQKNKQEGLTYQQLSSGKFKDTGSPDKELTAEEKELLMKDVEKMHQLFVENVAVNRNLDIKTVEKLADGSTMLGQDAKEKGLIDEIGNIDDAKNWLKSQLGIEPELCIYQ
jgi:protease-4